MASTSLLLSLVILALSLTALNAAPERKNTYDAKYDDIDVDKILANRRLRGQYYDCFADKKPCITADARFFKDKIPEALVTHCSRCTKKQEINIGKIVEYYSINEPDTWTEIITMAIEKQKKNKLKKQ